ncbi:cation-translocating P-type ATPase [Anaerocolumna sedimenticola]|uniref:cation-translocating P-type ATPase n=1 Tax=Anaerocolumna sedimenticola TaxID=2696063 RepID=UPI002FE6F4E8
MTVTELASVQGKEHPDTLFSHFLLSLAALCNDSILQVTGKGKHSSVTATGEPTEKALIMAAYHVDLLKPKLDSTNPRIFEIPFDSTRKLMTTVHNYPSGMIRSITKGAFDVLVNKCTHIYQNGKQVPMTKVHLHSINKLNQSMAERALRVIAVAYKDLPSETVLHKNTSKSSEQMSDYLETGLTLVGLIGMIDPPREEASDAVLTCQLAGIKPVMITGDHISTACAIAKELGIMTADDLAMTGQELSLIDQDTLIEKIPRYRVFARVSPEHKVRIVKAFQARGEVVAMTGDGVNDAPALKAADIGCAMGITGTDVAKNAADMILTDDNFATIVSAVKEGRGIYDNIKKAIHFLLSCNIGEIITIFVAILLGLPSPLLAVQLLWVNLVTDSLPAISLGVEPAAKDIMKKKPIPPDKGMFADGLVFKIIIEGILIGFLSLLAFIIGIRVYDAGSISDTVLRHGSTVQIAANITPYIGRTMAFAVLSLSQLFHSFNMRSEHSIARIGLFSNIKLLLSFIVCSFLQVIVISYKPLAEIFKVVPLTAAQWSVVLVLSFMPIVVVELQKGKK